MLIRKISSDRIGLLYGLQKVITYRRLIYLFAKRDLKVKYSQTYAGLLWSILQPVAGIIIFTFFFGRLLNVGTDGSPYPLFVLTGLIVWYYFSYIVAYSGISLIESQHLLKKVYFPRIILPFSKALTGLADFTIWFIMLIALMFYYGITPSYKIIFLPVFISLIIFTGLTVGIWLSALTYRYRDMIHIIPYLVGFSIFVTPVFYPAHILPKEVNMLLYINPMAGIISGFRWCLLDTISFSFKYLYGIIPMLFLFILSLIYFNRIEGEIADEV